MQTSAPTWISLISPAASAAIALLGVVVGAILGAQLTFRNQLKLTTLQARRQAYSEILGKRFLISQLYVSRFEAAVFSDYHERLWHLNGAPKESLDLDEGMRWMKKSEDLALEIAKTIESFLRSVGTAYASFPSNPELEGAFERASHFKTPVIVPPAAGADRPALDQWKTAVVPQLQKLVRDEYSENIDALLVSLKKHMNDRVSP